MNNDLHRRQLGKGTTNSDYDLTLVEPGFGNDIHFKTGNAGFLLVMPSNKYRWTISPDLDLKMGIQE